MTPQEPQSAAEYDDRTTAAVKSVLIEIGQILGSFKGKFAIIGGAVLAAGWALWTGRRWGRGLAIFAQLLLLPVAWYVAVGSAQWAFGVPIAVVAVATLVLLFSPSAVQWWVASGDDR